MSDADARAQEMPRRIAALEMAIEERHAFALQVFSCVIDLYGLAVLMNNTSSNDFDKSKFREGVTTLAESVNEAQRLSNTIVKRFKSEDQVDG